MPYGSRKSENLSPFYWGKYGQVCRNEKRGFGLDCQMGFWCLFLTSLSYIYLKEFNIDNLKIIVSVIVFQVITSVSCMYEHLCWSLKTGVSTKL